MTTTYVVLLHADERAWASADAETLARVRAAHVEFAQATLAGGHRIVGGEELAGSGTAVVVRREGDGFETSDGPYAETVEQIAGYYAVETDDLAGLTALVAPLAWHDGAAVEIRPIVDHSADLDMGTRAQAAANA